MKLRLFFLLTGFLFLSGLGCGSGEKPKTDKPDPGSKPTMLKAPTMPPPPPNTPPPKVD